MAASQQQGGVHAQVGEDKHRAVDDVDLSSDVAGGQRCVAGDHDQLVSAFGQHAQRGLAVSLGPNTAGHGCFDVVHVANVAMKSTSHTNAETPSNT